MNNIKTFNLKSGKTIKYKDICSCHLMFTIDNMQASDSYFGEGYDDSPESAPDYGCGNRKWKVHDDYEKIQATLKKYNISKEDFNEICEFLIIKLSVGCCSYCA